MDVPALVRQHLGDETPESTVSLGEDDALYVTPTRTLHYSGEGLFSDESVAEYRHDVERLDVTEGRRKATFSLTYVDGTDSLSVPRDSAEAVLDRLLGAILGTVGPLDGDESVLGTYRFSELTLVVTDRRLVKHVGEAVWDADSDAYAYEDLTGLAFEEGSVATQIVLSVEGHSERIKAPNEAAPLLERTLTEAVCAVHGVDSLAALNDLLGESAPDPEQTAPADSDVTLDESITPLVGGRESDGPGEEAPDATVEPPSAEGASDPAGSLSAPDETAGDADATSEDAVEAARNGEDPTGTTPEEGTATATGETADRERAAGTAAVAGAGEGEATEQSTPSVAEMDALREQVTTLSATLDRQAALLEEQRRAVETLENRLEDLTEERPEDEAGNPPDDPTEET